MRRHNKEARQSFGEWLDITLDNKGIRGRELAEATGVDDSTVSRWRAGASVPSMDVIISMATFLDLDWQRLAVTASILPSDAVPGIQPYPMPKPTARREAARRQIEKIRDLSPEGRDKLVEVYVELIEGDEAS